MDDHPKLKTALGISSRSLVHHWDKAGAPGQIPGYATHVNATSRAAKYMSELARDRRPGSRFISRWCTSISAVTATNG